MACVHAFSQKAPVSVFGKLSSGNMKLNILGRCTNYSLERDQLLCTDGADLIILRGGLDIASKAGPGNTSAQAVRN
jgi:hypothetical protein